MIISLRTLNRLFVLLTRLFKTLLLVTFLIFCFRIFSKFPLGDLYLQAEMVIEIFLLVFSIFYMLDLTKNSHQLILPDLFCFGAAFYTIYCAFMSKIQFGQPIVTGIIANRQYLLALSGVFVFYLLKNNIVSLLHLKRGFLFLTWFSLVIYLFLIAFVPESAIEGTRLYDVNEAKGGAVYRYDATFIVFGIIFYTIQGLSKNSFKSFFFASILILYILIFQKGRGLFLSTMIPIVIYIVFRVSWSKKIIAATVAGGFFVLFMLYNALLEGNNSLNGFLASYENVFSVLMGKETGEHSADSRIIQVTKVLEYWSTDNSKLIFGSGFLSNRWNDGFKKLFGHFYPVDIGIFGVTFVVGLFGFFYFKLQYLLAIKIWRKIKRVTLAQDVFIIALVYFILQIFFKSFLNGEDTFHSQKSILVIFIIYGYYFKALAYFNAKLKEKTFQPAQLAEEPL